jgi:DNA-binding NarL/FixJ family response regulator
LQQGPDSWILVADRDADRAIAMCELISRLGIPTDTATTGVDAVAAARCQRPALVVLELELDEPSGYEVCRELREEFGETLPIVFLTSTRTEPHDEIAALLIGADDYFVRPLMQERFLARIRRLLARVPAPTARVSLTKREQEVLTLLVDGRRRAEIAEELCITPKTASTHIERILSKLGAHSQAQAVAVAVRDRLLSGVS